MGGYCFIVLRITVYSCSVPEPGVLVTLTKSGSAPVSGTTDSQGRLDLTLRSAGIWQYTATKADFEFNGGPITVVCGDDLELAIHGSPEGEDCSVDLPSCFCQGIPTRLAMVSSDQAADGGMFRDATLVYRLAPPELFGLSLGGRTYLSENSYVDQNGDTFWYHFTCELADVVLSRVYEHSIFGSPYKDVVRYSWSLGDPANHCCHPTTKTLSLTSGQVYSGGPTGVVVTVTGIGQNRWQGGLDLTVRRCGSSLVTGATVTATRSGYADLTGLTGSNGFVQFNFPEGSDGDWEVTVEKAPQAPQTFTVIADRCGRTAHTHYYDTIGQWFDVKVYGCGGLNDWLAGALVELVQGFNVLASATSDGVGPTRLTAPNPANNYTIRVTKSRFNVFTLTNQAITCDSGAHPVNALLTVDNTHTCATGCDDPIPRTTGLATPLGGLTLTYNSTSGLLIGCHAPTRSGVQAADCSGTGTFASPIRYEINPNAFGGPSLVIRYPICASGQTTPKAESCPGPWAVQRSLVLGSATVESCLPFSCVWNVSVPALFGSGTFPITMTE